MKAIVYRCYGSSEEVLHLEEVAKPTRRTMKSWSRFAQRR